MSDAGAIAHAFTVSVSDPASQPAFRTGAALRVAETSGEARESRERGDSVIFSDQGRTMAARQAQTQESSSDEDQQEALIRQLKERIAKLQQEIEELQQDPTLSEDEKHQQLLSKQSELAELETQLQEAYEEQANAASQGAGQASKSSLTTYGARA